ncbi:hypothetical protein B0H14DRAFT_3134530 [Mycena olivaceomarginata]|nr:hypothetical protein B0H14DRAFT_3134530 [Mycena olivaceomarginata]
METIHATAAPTPSVVLLLSAVAVISSIIGGGFLTTRKTSSVKEEDKPPLGPARVFVTGNSEARAETSAEDEMPLVKMEDSDTLLCSASVVSSRDDASVMTVHGDHHGEADGTYQSVIMPTKTARDYLPPMYIQNATTKVNMNQQPYHDPTGVLIPPSSLSFRLRVGKTAKAYLT